MKFLENGN